uniref:Probable serine/threonine-protein kinase pats1-like n=1 Tax=Saccoglossus kowalevskii TaxID=10224 RepID=A0ABM0LVH8_SACKO|nr:PREDICTED: probable serine/threonine-protein kinase pats1-like [Saccoglossus kowalevskii]
MSQCVINGQRPSLDEVPDDCPKFLLKIMKDCWNGIPNERPTFCKLKEIVDKEILEYEKTGEVSKAMEDLHKQAREKTRGSQPEEPEEASSVDQITSGMSGVQVDDDIATDSDPINPSDNGDNHERDHRQLPSNVTSSLQETHESQEEVSSATSPKKSLKKYEPQYPEKIVTDRLLLDVSVKIQGEWKIVAGYLGIPQHEINGIAIDNASYGAQEQACQMLNKWHQRNGGEATHKALAKALNKAERNDIVKML